MSFIYTAKVNIMAVILTKAENFTDRYNTAHKEEKMCNLHKILERRICELFVCYVPQKWLKNSREIYVPNLWHFKQELPAIVFEKCHRILGWQSFQNSLGSSSCQLRDTQTDVWRMACEGCCLKQGNNEGNLNLSVSGSGIFLQT